MAAAIDEDEKTILNCTLCSGELKKPKLLPCQHSFCTECLVQLYNDVKEGTPFCCPTCQMDIKQGDDAIQGLPNNYLYEVVKDTFSKVCTFEAKCVSCAQDDKQTNATHKCLDCGDTLCQHCNTWHCKFTVAKHHVVVPIADLQEGKFQDEFSRRKVLYCAQHSTKEHQVPMSSYCIKCKCLVCFDCIQNDHYGHCNTKLHDERRKQQRVCEDHIKTLQMSQKDQEIRIKNIQKALLKTKQIWGQQETDLFDTAADLYALIDKIKEEKLNELKTLYEKEIQHLSDLLKEERNTMNSLKATIAFTKMFVEKCSDSDFLYYDKDIRARMETSKKRPSQNSKRKLVVTKKQGIESVKQGLDYVFGRIQTQIHFLHKGRIGLEKEKFRRTLGPGQICGLSYGVNCNEIFLVGKKDSKINILTEDGHLGRSITLENTPSDIHVHTKNDLIYATVSEKNFRQVIIMTQNGVVQRKLQIPDDDQNNNDKLSIAIGEDNRVFIASPIKDRIYTWHPEEDKMSIIISKEKGHKLASPQCICMTPSDELVVLNCGSSIVQIYSKEGKLQWQHERNLGCTYKPISVCCDEDGYIYVIHVHNIRGVYRWRIKVFRDETTVGTIKLNDKEIHKHQVVPLVPTPDGDLIYGNGQDLVRLSFWE